MQNTAVKGGNHIKGAIIMTEFFFDHYDWIRSLHIISIISWMAGMLYLPRLFVYHVDAKKGSELSETLKIMERKLLRYIMNPAMILSWAFGLMMLSANTTMLQSGGWMHVKLTCVVLMTVMHMIFARHRRLFANDENKKTQKYFRIANEIPTVLMIVIVIMAIIEPF
tara:strand:- start:269 stop:769 length:501 start_codon:yes stop_codon:yes gene_type:complete